MPTNPAHGETRLLVRNSAALFLANVTGKIFALAFFALVARHLGPAGFGELAWALSMIGLLSIVGDFGLDTVLIRDASRDPSRAGELLVRTVRARMLLCLLMGAATGALVLSTGESSRRAALGLLGLGAVLQVMGGAFQALCVVRHAAGYVAWMSLVQGATFLTGGAVVWWLGGGVGGIAAVFPAAYGAALLYLRGAVRRLGVRPQAAEGGLAALLREAVPYALVVVGATAYYRLDVLLLSALRSQAEVGWYSAAQRLVLALLIVPDALMRAAFPMTARLHGLQGGEADLSRVTRQVSRWLMLALLPVALVTSVLAERVIGVIYGAEYGPSVAVLRMLIWLPVVAALDAALGNVFYSTDRQWVITTKLMGCLALNVGLNLVWIPRYGVMGSAAAAVLAGGAGLAFLWIALARQAVRVPAGGLLRDALPGAAGGIALAGLLGWWAPVLSTSALALAGAALAGAYAAGLVAVLPDLAPLRARAEAYLKEVVRRLTDAFYPGWEVDAVLRYLPMVQMLRRERVPGEAILEVGPGERGITAYLDGSVIGVEPRPPGHQGDRVRFVVGTATALPFRDRAAPWVVCADMLEHVSREARVLAIREMLRVAGRGVLIAVPCGWLAARADAWSNAMHVRMQGRDHDWLREHLENGLPERAELVGVVEKAARAMGRRAEVRVRGNVWIPVWLFLCWLRSHRSVWLNRLERVGGLWVLPFLRHWNWAPSYRSIFFIRLAS